MKPEAQRIAIAEFCGKKTKVPVRELRFGPSHDANGKKIVDKIIGYKPAKLPNYLSDLNAMHEAEKKLTEHLATDYVLRLEKLPVGFPVGINVSCVISWRLAHATAAQRAEALLRTIGKWTE